MLLLCSLFSACTPSTEGFERDGEPILSDPSFQRTPPAVKEAEYVGTNQQVREADGNSAVIDMTNVAQGYIAVKSTSLAESLVRVTKTSGSTSDVDDYRFASDGTVQFLPITRGDGTYTFDLMHRGEETATGANYYSFLVAEATVALESEFAPFLVPNIFVSYTADSSVVAKSYEIAQHASTDLEVAQQIYYWIAGNITYDTFKAEQIKGALLRNYTPNPDDTLAAKKGICYDYASLAAAMLRANGIPCQLIKGDVKQGKSTLYHAWNLFWTEETGWISIKMPTSAHDWNRIDLTFVAGRGSSLSQFIGDGENYNGLAAF
ncbi:MAG: transglutaminase-like domain-containing protein [Oscillospiraceae bacterium]